MLERSFVCRSIRFIIWYFDRVLFWTLMWKTWIIDSEDSATMLTLARRSSRRRRWFSASGEQARFPWPWGSVTAWTQTQGFPGNSGLAKFLGSFSLAPNNQICGTTRDEPKEHSGEKLLWHCLQQQCCWVPHRAWLQVIKYNQLLGKEIGHHWSLIQAGVWVYCEGIHLQEGQDQGHSEQGRCHIPLIFSIFQVIILINLTNPSRFTRLATIHQVWTTLSQSLAHGW